MSDTNVQDCNCCQVETDCVDGLCELCSAYNYKLQKQSNLLTLGLLQEKSYVAAIREQYDKDMADTNRFYYPKAVCRRPTPTLYTGFNTCLSCPMSKTCRLLYKRETVGT